MKTIEKLVGATNNMKLGNHKVEQTNNGAKFYYYATVICQTNDNMKTFYIDASYGSVSTTKACNAYRYELLSLGYKETTKEFFLAS